MPLLILIVIVILALYFVPMLVLWAINYLFHFYIDYTFGSWMAVMVLLIVLRGKFEFTFTKY